MAQLSDDGPKSLLLFIPYLILAEIILSFLIALRPSWTWRVFGFCLYTFVNLYGTAFTIGNVMLDYTIGSAFANNIFTAWHFLWLSDGQNDLRHNHSSMDPQQLPLLQRMYLAMCVKGSVRGVGWHGQVSNIPPAPVETRWHFVLSRVLKALQFFLLADVFQTYLHINPLSSLDDRLGRFPATALDSYFWRCLNIIAWVGRPYGLLNVVYYLLGASAVAVGFSEPRYWPAFFGSWRDAYTVRIFWGRIWHQELRRFTTSIGKLCARTLKCEPGSLASSYTQLYAAFAISGLIHSLGDAMIGVQYVGYSFPFFIVQAFAIAFETVVISIARKVGVSHCDFWGRFLGYTWVFWWFSMSVPMFMWQVEAGLGDSKPFLRSPSFWVLRTITQKMG